MHTLENFHLGFFKEDGKWQLSSLNHSNRTEDTAQGVPDKVHRVIGMPKYRNINIKTYLHMIINVLDIIG